MCSSDLTRERATEFYDTASEKAAEAAAAAREAASRQVGSVSAAIEAGKKAYVEEKRKTELSGRSGVQPNYEKKG